MIPLAVPNLSGRESEYLEECVRSNFVSSVGPFVTRLEEMVAKASGAQFGVSVSSGTAGIHLALISVGVRRDDLVILPSFTFIGSANAITHCGADPWLYDVDPESWTLDTDLLKKSLESETRREGGKVFHKATGKRVGAIVPVYTLGVPADMEPMIEIARHYGLPLVADAAAALGAIYKNRPIGELADLTVFSFNGNKTITAGGGGVVVGNDKTLANLVRHLSTTARVGRDYDHDLVGYNCRMTNLQAAVGCAQMERLDEFVAAKRRIREAYDQEFGKLEGIGLFPQPHGCESSCWFSGITVNSSELPSVPLFCEQLIERGIEARRFWKPIHLQTPYLPAPRTSQTVSEDLWERVLTLPCSTHLSREDQSYVVRCLLEILRAGRPRRKTKTQKVGLS